MLRRLHFLTALSFLLGSTFIAFAQEPGCDMEPCPNPVACAQCSGSWTDEYNGYWSITSNASNQVSGTLYVDLSGFPNCVSQSYTVSGSLSPVYGSGDLNGYSSINITATDPYPGSTPGCQVASYANLVGNIQNDGCDWIPDATLNTDLQSNVSTSFYKNADMPSGENDTFRAWSQQWPTIGQWQGNLTTSTVLDGRQVSESQSGSTNDSCWFQGSSYDKAGLSGGWWNVGFYFQNAYNDDYVGWLPDAVTYYRNNTILPCQADIPQQMNIAVVGTSGETASYFSGTQTWWMSQSSVGSGKNGVLQMVTWP